ncbi:amidase [Skermanella mucosa]|uniref:amidase n=1 Tax=Skermanella mucosa TaxID=1789672 RepID=UPI00192CAC3C|nr:amidase [Skermanella mucosa]UEM22937.1 amidase [Skermanella mucosa]
MKNDPALLSATELLVLYRSRRLSPVEVTQACLDLIAAVDAELNAFTLVDGDAAMESARASEERWLKGKPLGLVDGVPTTIKDLLLTKGWPTLRGSKAISPDQPWEEDAPATARLREQGAILLGKTTTPELGHKGVTDSPLTGITRNPWNPAMTPGGSSGGAAVAAATGMGALHVGTDGGGSIRIPASFTGIFGLKPSFGRVPAYPASPFGTVSHVGPMTRTVPDAALMLRVLACPDPRDWYALPPVDKDYLAGLDGGVAGLKVAFAPTLNGAPVDPEVAALVRRAATEFTDLGAEVEEVMLDLPGTTDVFFAHWSAGAATVMAGFTEEQKAMMDPHLRGFESAGASLSLLDYQQAVLARARLGMQMSLFHRRYDILLTPAMPIPAFEAGQNEPSRPDETGWIDWTPFSYPFNLTQQPAASIPCGLTAAGLPVGLQIVGPMHRDDLVLRAARAYEMQHPIALPPGRS